jgi:hypothetical protein
MIMKKVFLTGMASLAAIVAVNAQQISVVAPGGATALYTSLDTAIVKAAAGSTIYLSGGGFQVNNATKITKKLTIIGIGHRADNDNADGNTVVSGNLFFNENSDNSALMGLYLSGNVNIATSANAVNNILVRYCNVNAIGVGNSNCQGIVINQNYLRGTSNGGNSPLTFSNNVSSTIAQVTGGNIIHNVVTGSLSYVPHPGITYSINNSNISNNIIKGGTPYCSGTISNNMSSSSFGDNSIVVESWDDVFAGPDNGVNTSSNFKLKGSLGKNAATDGSDVGIYGGAGFSDLALPPGPRIVRKVIADQTDENGNLRVQIEVKVGE